MGKILAFLYVILAITFASAARDPFAGLEDAKALHIQTGNAGGLDRVGFQTPYGRIVVKLLTQNAPKATALVRQLAETDGCKDCKFYRNEARPSPMRDEPPEGPPYSLLQGQLNLPSIPESEGDMEVNSGHVAFIPGTSDFFISLGDHPEWEKSHTVWGVVEDFVSTDLIAIQPWHEITHDKYGTKMRMMNDPVSFRVTTDVDSF